MSSNLIWREFSPVIQVLTVDAMEALWKVMLAALVVCLALFMEALSCLLMPPPNMFPLLTLVPVVLVPVPFCLIRACGGGDSELSETPRRAYPCANSALRTDEFCAPCGCRGKHWAEFFTAMIATGVFAVPALLLITHTIHFKARRLVPPPYAAHASQLVSCRRRPSRSAASASSASVPASTPSAARAMTGVTRRGC